jgi:hypothetical protein
VPIFVVTQAPTHGAWSPRLSFVTYGIERAFEPAQEPAGDLRWGCWRPMRPSNWHLGVAANEANLTAVVSSAVACERLAEAVVAFRESEHVADVLMAAELDGPRAVCRLDGLCFAGFTGRDDGGRPLPSYRAELAGLLLLLSWLSSSSSASSEWLLR